MVWMDAHLPPHHPSYHQLCPMHPPLQLGGRGVRLSKQASALAISVPTTINPVWTLFRWAGLYFQSMPIKTYYPPLSSTYKTMQTNKGVSNVCTLFQRWCCRIWIYNQKKLPVKEVAVQMELNLECTLFVRTLHYLWGSLLTLTWMSSISQQLSQRDFWP